MQWQLLLLQLTVVQRLPPGIAGMSNLAVEISGDATTAANSIAAINNVIEKAGVVTVVAYSNSLKLDELIDATNKTTGLQGTGNKVSLTVHTDASGPTAAASVTTTANAASLTDLNAKTTGLITVEPTSLQLQVLLLNCCSLCSGRCHCYSHFSDYRPWI